MFCYNFFPARFFFLAQTQRDRKEALTKIAIEYYDQGKMWERAITLMKELRAEYESMYQFDKLADLLVS